MAFGDGLMGDGPRHSTRGVLYWIYASRLALVLATYGAALFVGGTWLAQGLGITDNQLRTGALSAVAIVTVFTAASYHYSHSRPYRRLGAGFVVVQAALDLFLVTVVVVLTGGSESVLPALLYIALVSGYGLILPVTIAVLLAVTAGVAYLAAITAAYPDQLAVGVGLQVVIFTVVALVTALIGVRLRQLGSELSSVERELRRLRVGTSDILRAIDAAVVTVDTRGHAVYINPAATELLGIEPDRWLGEAVLETLGGRAPGVALAARETIEGAPPVRNREVDVLGDGGLPLPYSVSTAVVDRPGEAPVVTLVLQDLRMARQLEELHLRASRLGVVAELAASLAHEIKNPLASIRSAIEQISDDTTDPDDRKMLTRLVLREADRLSRLLSEFNDFARVGVGERKPLELERLVGEAVQLVTQRPEAEGRAVFHVEMKPELDDLWGDPDLIHRTLTNLMLNAIQVSEPGEVNVRVVVDTLAEDLVPAEIAPGSPVRIRVIDDGPGIAPEDLGRIFDPFYTRRQGGSGMGLAIAHRAVQAHGGALLVSSTLGHGATFAIVLPRRDWQERHDLEQKGWTEQVQDLQRRYPHLSARPADESTPALGELADRIR